ncbi:MAG: radical SAM/SPASM domain-containing protein [Promethearchaeota archaeon]
MVNPIKLKKLRSPVYVNFDITDNCNQSCKFCFNSKKNDSYASFEDLKNIIDKIKEAEVFEINLLGGEPFIHPEIESIIKYCDSKDFITTFVSNGTLINEDMLDTIANHLDGGSISIHGFKETHENLTGNIGSYDKAIKTLEELSKRIPTGVCYTLVKENMDELYPFGNQLIDNYDIGFFGVSRFIPMGVGGNNKNSLEVTVEEFNESVKKIKVLKEKYPNIDTYITDSFPYCLLEDKELQKYVSSCSAGVDFCSIDSQGNVKFCSATDHILGNIYDNSLEDIWQNNKILNDYRSLDWIPEECKNCEDNYGCLFGCKVSSGDVYGIDIAKKNKHV